MSNLHVFCLTVLLLSAVMIISLYDVSGGFIEKISLTSKEKNSISLLVILLLSSIALNLTVIFLELREHRGYIPTASLALFCTTAISFVYYFVTFRSLYSLLLLPLMAIFIVAYLRSRGEGIRFFSLNTKEISLIAVLSSLTAVLTSVVGSVFPSPTGGYTHIGDTIIFLAGLMFGSKVGFFTGSIGAMVADIIVGYPRWYVSIVAHGLEGFIAGLAKNKRTGTQVLTLAVAGIVMALTYYIVNIYIKGYAPAFISLIRDVFGQAGVSLILSILIYKNMEKTGLIGRI